MKKKKRKLILKLDYGTIVVKNLVRTWIEPTSTSIGYTLCYQDDVYEKYSIYHSTNMALLLTLQSKMMRAYAKGKDKVRL